jgi:hypothetical protein
LKHFYIIAFALFCGSVFSINAQDLIILRDGNVIEAKVAEIAPTEIRYRRFNHLTGPLIIIAKTDVLSIRYENKTVEIINPISAGQQTDMPASLQSGEPTLLQQALNLMPAIPIAGNNLKFEFRGGAWIARVNGENFSAGTIDFKTTTEGGILTLRQTHIWPGTVGKTAGRVANVIPGGNAVGGALNTAGNVAGVVGPVEMSGTVIVLEYKAGPPSSLKFLSSSQNDTAKNKTASSQEEKSANVRNNWMSYELAFIGIGIRYERMLSSKISLGLNTYFGPPLFDTQYFEINTFFRGYPWGKTFFLGVGLGYAHIEEEDYARDSYGYYGRYYVSNVFTIIPEIGWKIDVGKPGGFYIMPSLLFPLVLGDNNFIMVPRVFYFGMGHAW